MSTYVSPFLRQHVFERAKGRCEYCLTPQQLVFVPHEVDHIIALKHGGLTEVGNLALSCTLCNKYKGTDLASVDPETGAVVPLFNPRLDDWAAHFRMDGGHFTPLTPTARATVRLLRLNAPERVEERRLMSRAGVLTLPTNH
jgi:hypothetical protein